MRTVRIPQYVDELMQVGFWELDEAIFLVLGLIIGTITGWMFTGIIIGTLCSGIFAKYKSGHNRGMLLHAVYWYGLIPFKGLWCDNAFKRLWTN
ncbi:type IV conjugative transfer system protein TraL [Thalassotalea piscium]|uniref:Conjugal transfer pilus assembly protein TraL n=1 Tax=Thalassotalea piscium TaxID=1230533 RepID=A0A7X0NKJ6_9GAMM|nr:type IV conjugative transfer system protein TraL [Thalassotalea piscium]MBB6545142.1 conjugal transfer pilus assembly protein TraL [Thalassotalea piscium]